MSNDLASGWYSDAGGKKRYWDGEHWSDFKFEGTELSSPVTAPPTETAHLTGNAKDGDPIRSAPPKRSKKIRIVVASVVVGVLMLSGGAALWKVSSDSRAEQVAASERKAEEEQRSNAAARAEQAAETAERAHRAETVTALEASIVEDANESVAEGILDGPILSGICTPTGGGSTDDLTALTGTFECIAVTEQNGDQSRGYAYSATINWSDSSYTWRLGN